MKRAHKYTIDEIAEIAKVSKATVSRVMNGTATVSEAKRRRVESTIKKLGFEPNQNARKLAGGLGGAVAMVLEESTEEFFGNPFWKEVVQGFIDQASAKNLHPVLFFHSKQESDDKLVSALARGNFDGVAIFGWHRDIKILEKYVPENMIVVFGGNQGKSRRFTYVGVDNVVGGELATERLIQAGCKKIITITGDLSVQSARERLTGYKSALEKSGIAFKESRVLHGDFGSESCERVLREYLKKGVAFDGIFAANDVMAVAALRILKEAKIKVPREVKLIGFDGSAIARNSSPSITSVAQSSYQQGRLVAENLIKAFERQEISNVELELNLIEGESTSGKA